MEFRESTNIWMAKEELDEEPSSCMLESLEEYETVIHGYLPQFDF